MWICSWTCRLGVYLRLSNKNDGNLPVTGSAHLPFLGFKGKQPHGSLGHSIPLPVPAACASFHNCSKHRGPFLSLSFAPQLKRALVPPLPFFTPLPRPPS